MTSPAPLGRVRARLRWEWFWQGAAMRDVASRVAPREAGALALARAVSAAEVGEHALTPSNAWTSGDASLVAARLFVDSIAWSLRAAAAEPGAEPKSWPERQDVAQLVEAQQQLLVEATADAAACERLRSHLLERGFETSSDRGEVQRAARELGSAAKRLIGGAKRARAEVDAIWLQRCLRVGSVLACLVGLVAGSARLHRSWDEGRDLAKGSPWRASTAGDVACVSPSQHCGRRYFFHTADEASPWLEIDLGKAQTFSRVRISNRADCCRERAIPLVVEVSLDQKNWRQVASRSDDFVTWTAAFAPSSARWVRLRVTRKSLLHLNDVKILP